MDVNNDNALLRYSVMQGAPRQPVEASPAACADIPENPVRNNGTHRIIQVFCKLTRAG